MDEDERDKGMEGWGRNNRISTKVWDCHSTERRVKTGEQFLLLKRKVAERDGGGDIIRMEQCRLLCSEMKAGGRRFESLGKEVWNSCYME